MGKINKYKRHQPTFRIADMYPSIIGHCACGCGRKLTGKRTRWATTKCMNKVLPLFLVIWGHVTTIRKLLFKRDKGICAGCRKHCNNEIKWYADHIVAVCNGGGGCTLNNFATLCYACHKIKTKSDLLFKRRKKR